MVHAMGHRLSARLSHTLRLRRAADGSPIDFSGHAPRLDILSLAKPQTDIAAIRAGCANVSMIEAAATDQVLDRWSQTIPARARSAAMPGNEQDSMSNET